MASPFPFTSGQVLTAAQLNSIGEVTAFTPSWTNFTPGNATEDWVYIQVNDLVYFVGQTVLGSTSSVTGIITMDFPVGTNTINGNPLVGLAFLVKISPLALYKGVVDESNTGTMRFFYETVSGSNVVISSTSSTAPFTWGTGDVIRASGVLAVS